MASRTRTSSSTTDRATRYAKAVVAGKIVAGPHVRNTCRRHLDDLRGGSKRGLWYDEDAAARAIRFFETRLKLSEGQFEGQPLILHDSQAFIVGSLFGWKRKSDNTRRFRRAYIEQGKGNGKSPLAGGIGLYGLTADGEAGAEIYSAGATKDQAGILFRDAVKMVRKSPDLEKRLKFSGGEGREYNIAYLAKSSFFRPVSRETKKTGSGPRPHFALCDEVHEHPDRGTMEMLERGFKFRRQPLLFMITNSGSDRNSVCWEEHEHAIRVAAGNPNAKDDDPHYLGEVIDDTTFAFVCSLDPARKVSYPFDIALCHVEESCTCNALTTLTDLPSPQDFAALVTQERGGRTISRRASGASITPTVRLLLDAFASIAIPTDASSAAQRQSSVARNGSGHGPSPLRALPRAGSEIGSTESERSRRTLTGPATGYADPNTGSPSNRSSKSARPKAAAAQSAARHTNAFEWIIATTTALFGDFCARTATLELACSEIMSRLYNGHSTTCETRQRFRLQSGLLTEDIPGDDPLNDPRCWPKANPLLGVTITEEYLAGVVAQAKAMPGKLNGILRLHFCVWTDAETAWMTRETLEPCLADFDPAEHHGKRIAKGIDLSQARDLTVDASIVETGSMPVEVIVEGQPKVVEKPTYDCWITAWTPGDTIAARALRDKAPYEVWVRQEHLLAPKGETIRFDHVAQALADDSRDFDIGLIGYDRYAFKRFEDECNKLGLSLQFVEHPQGGTKKGKPTDAMKRAAEAEGREAEGLWMPGSLRILEECILERRIRFKINPVLISAMMSAVTDEDRWGNRWLAKERAVNKIDAVIAVCMAIGAITAMGSSTAPKFQMIILG